MIKANPLPPCLLSVPYSSQFLQSSVQFGGHLETKAQALNENLGIPSALRHPPAPCWHFIIALPAIH
jgi:hypothetical protein